MRTDLHARHFVGLSQQMDETPKVVAKSRAELSAALAKNRRESLSASERGDFRAVARLTLEAAQLNRALANLLPKE